MAASARRSCAGSFPIVGVGLSAVHEGTRRLTSFGSDDQGFIARLSEAGFFMSKVGASTMENDQKSLRRLLLPCADYPFSIRFNGGLSY